MSLERRTHIPIPLLIFFSLGCITRSGRDYSPFILPPSIDVPSETGVPLIASILFDLDHCVQRLREAESAGAESDAEFEDVDDATHSNTPPFWYCPLPEVVPPSSPPSKMEKLKAGSKRRRKDKRGKAQALGHTNGGGHQLKAVYKRCRLEAALVPIKTNIDGADLHASGPGWIGLWTAEGEHIEGEYCDKELEDLKRRFEHVDWDGRCILNVDLASPYSP